MCLFFLAVQGGFSLIIALCFAECYLLVESIHIVFAAQLINNDSFFSVDTLPGWHEPEFLDTSQTLTEKLQLEDAGQLRELQLSQILFYKVLGNPEN